LQHGRPLSDWLQLAALVVLWGTAFLFVKLTLDSLPPATLVGLRLLIAAAVLSLILHLRGLRLPTSPTVWAHYFLMGFVGSALPFCLISWGQLEVDTGVTGILMGVMPLVTLLLAHFFVPGERMTRRRVLGFVAGFIGLIILVGPEALREIGGQPSDLIRQTAILLAAVCFAVNTIIARHLAKLDALVSSATVMWTASFIVVPISLFVDRPWQLAPSFLSVVSVIWLGLFATGLATTIYFRLVASAGPSFLSQMNYLIPVVALTVGWLILSEALSGAVAIGLVFILSGLAIASGASASR
jgi:drug/metabolite transporter (DMT)-like permease